jgi:myo-inositol 2-dehydrogenase/D-chiro-inositol 1-dehydrogenase
MNMTLRICMVGCGSMSTSVHGPSYHEYASLHPDAILAACCDLDANKAEKYMKMFGFRKHYTDLDVMLDTEKPDAVCLVVQDYLTAKLSKRIMEKGYPLLMEKPPGINKEETIDMIKTADQYDIPTGVAFNRRSMPLVRKLRRMLEERFESNELQHIRYDFYRVNRMDSDFSTTAIHGLDTVKFLAGSDYARIRLQYQSIPNCPPEVVNIYMDCEFESGVKAFLSFCPVSGTLLERATVQAAGNTFFLNVAVGDSIDYPGSLTHYEQGQVVSYPSEQADLADQRVFVTGGFYDENAMFFEDIRAGRAPIHDLRSSLQSVEIAECIRERKLEYTK